MPARIHALPEGGRLVEEAAALGPSLAHLCDAGRLRLMDGTWIEPGAFVQYHGSGRELARFGIGSEHCCGLPGYPTGNLSGAFVRQPAGSLGLRDLLWVAEAMTESERPARRRDRAGLLTRDAPGYATS